MANDKSYVGLMACPRCGEPTGVVLDRRLRDTFEDGKRYAGELCKSCQEELALFEQVVERGGIYFQCKQCGREGVIKYSASSAEFCEWVRKQQFGEDDPDWKHKPVGVELYRCDQHGEEQEAS